MTMSSVVSYPDRGHWGKSSWRGNSTGHIYKDLFEQYRPSFFVDPMMGSGTSIEVAKEMKIEALGLDLHAGFNILRDSILERAGKPADMVVSHPPYGSMIRYSGSVWGSQPHPDDLSHCINDDDFCEKLQQALLNQREATKGGGYYGMLIGDMRKDGVYTSWQAEMIARMPKNELASVIIKQQHNTMSGRNTYSKMKHPFIVHEYLIMWTRPQDALSMLVDLSNMAKYQATRMTSIWKAVVRQALVGLGGKASLSALYEKVAKSAPEKLQQNQNWQAKVRQVLQSYADFNSDERGVWTLA